MPPFSPTSATSPGEPTPSRRRLNIGRGPMPMRRRASSNQSRCRRYVRRREREMRCRTSRSARRRTRLDAVSEFSPTSLSQLALCRALSHDLRRLLRNDSPCLVRRSTGNLLHHGPPDSTEVQATATMISTGDGSTRPRGRASELIASPPYPPEIFATPESAHLRRPAVGRPITAPSIFEAARFDR